MCKAINYTTQLLEIYNNINTDVKRLKDEVSTANQFNLDMLHTIENTNFNACEGYLLAKQIKDNQTFRRQAKLELETLIKLKSSFIDTNMDLLNLVSQEIINEDNRYKYNIEHKVYNPKVMGKKAPDSVVKRPAHSKPPKFIPIPIHSIPAQPKENNHAMLGNAVHKKTNEQIQVINKLDDTHYFIVRKDGHKEIINTKNMIDFNYYQTAK